MAVDPLLDPKTRLVGFLACLVLSMTVGMGVLRWLEPADSAVAIRRAQLPSSEGISHVALAMEAPMWSGRWNGIAVDVFDRPVLASGSGGPALAALPERDDCHFVVDVAGQIVATDVWRKQMVAKGSIDADAIRVSLVRRPRHDGITKAQWQTFARLVEVLRTHWPIRPEDIRVNPDHTAIAQPGPASSESWTNRLEGLLTHADTAR